MDKPSAPAALRNSEPICNVIRREFKDCKSILEIGSGTGQHAVYFAGKLPWLEWHTSDLENNHAGILAWIDEAQPDNVKPPIVLDVRHPPHIGQKFDGIFSANTAHIMSIAEVERMFGVAASCLDDGGRFCLYGPFKLDGAHTSESNEQFDASLKSQNPDMGVRDLELLDAFGVACGFVRTGLYAMPANNMIAVWEKH